MEALKGRANGNPRWGHNSGRHGTPLQGSRMRGLRFPGRCPGLSLLAPSGPRPHVLLSSLPSGSSPTLSAGPCQVRLQLFVVSCPFFIFHCRAAARRSSPEETEPVSPTIVGLTGSDLHSVLFGCRMRSALRPSPRREFQSPGDCRPSPAHSPSTRWRR
jgi:hypothetical protein